ncbi:hypothetical protein LguiB_013212 [Lonicera macranthoides]
MEYSAGFAPAIMCRLLLFGLVALAIYFMIVVCGHLTCLSAFKLGLIAMGFQAFWCLFLALVNCYADLANS